MLDCILLVDDNEADNFMHSMVLEDVGCANEIKTAANGEEALDLFDLAKKEGTQTPDLIFVDINMPIMNGWDFLNAFQERGYHENCNSVFIMLSTSMNPHDKAMSQGYDFLNDFITKPLTQKTLEGLLKKHFPNKF